jgi:hypothetical protein
MTFKALFQKMSGDWRELVAGMQASLKQQRDAISRQDAQLGHVTALVGMKPPGGVSTGSLEPVLAALELQQSQVKQIHAQNEKLRQQVAALLASHNASTAALAEEKAAREKLERVVLSMAAVVEKGVGPVAMMDASASIDTQFKA